MAADSEQSEGRRAPRDFLWPIVAGGLLAVLSAYQLGALSLWRDEVATVVYASSPLDQLIHSLTTTEANQTVYYLFMHLWLKAGDGEAWIRLPSLIFGVATVLPIYLIARRLGGQVAGVLAAFIFAGSRFAVRWDQEAREYSLAMLVAAILTWLLLRALDRPTPGRWAAYGLCAAVGFYVHFFVIFVVAAHVLFVVASRSWPRGRALAGAAVPIVLAALPLPAIAVVQGHVIDWIPRITLVNLADIFAGAAGGQVLLVVMIELAGLAVLLQRRQRLLWLIVAWLVIPPAAAVLISLVKPVLVVKYLAVSIPALAVLAGAALGGIRQRGAMIASVAGVALLLAIALPQVYQRSAEDWRPAAQWMAAVSRPGDRIVYLSPLGEWAHGDWALEYYLHRAGLVAAPARVDIAATLSDVRGLVWLVTSESDRGAAARIRTQLEQRYTLVDERSVGGGRLIRVALFRPSG